MRCNRHLNLIMPQTELLIFPQVLLLSHLDFSGSGQKTLQSFLIFFFSAPHPICREVMSVLPSKYHPESPSRHRHCSILPQTTGTSPAFPTRESPKTLLPPHLPTAHCQQRSQCSLKGDSKHGSPLLKPSYGSFPPGKGKNLSGAP